MLRKNLPPLDFFLADAVSLSVDAFARRYIWPFLLIPEPDPDVLAQIRRPNTVAFDEDDPTMQISVPDPSSPAMSGASLDTLCLELRPKNPSSSQITFGRSPDADVVLLDGTISRLHATLTWDRSREHTILRDLAGRNGTQVDDAAVAPGTEVPLFPGALVVFGKLITRYHSPRSFQSWLSTGAPRISASPKVWPRSL